MIDNLHPIERKSRGAALARHYIEREAAADDDTTRKAWGLAVSGAVDGRERDWFAMNQAGDTVTVWIKNEIGCGRSGAEAFLAALQDITKIELFINSNGGDSACALELFRGLQGRVTEAIISNKCYSAAVTVAMAAKNIRLEKSARMMIHAPRLFRYGQAGELRQSADYLDRITGDICTIIAERTRQPAAVVKKWLLGDTYFSSSKAISVGLADELWEAPPPPDALKPGDGAILDNTDEPEFWRCLSRFESLRVKDQKKFMENLARWVVFKTKTA